MSPATPSAPVRPAEGEPAGGAIDVAPWRPADPLPAWAGAVPGPDIALDWTRLVADSTPGVQAHGFLLGPADAPEALGCLHVVRGIDLGAYIGGAAARVAGWLGRVGWRPLAMDIAFVELPLLHLPGFFADPALPADRRVALFDAFIEACRAVPADLLVARVLDDTPEASAGGLARVPFMPNLVVPLAPGEDWLDALPGRWRRKVGQRRRLLARRGGSVRIHWDALPDPERLAVLFESTCRRHADELQHPIGVTAALLRRLGDLPRERRFVVGVYAGDQLAAFCLGLRTGDRVLLRTTGVDGRLSHPLHGNANLDPPAIALAQRLGCDRVDLGPTAAGSKRRLGARPVPTAYRVDPRRWYLRPIIWLVDARFGREARAPALPGHGTQETG